MSSKVIVNENSEIYLRDEWHEYNNTLVKGSAYIKGILYRGKELAEYIDKTFKDDMDEYNNLNGFFVCIRKQVDELQIISDRVRSFPLFYLLKDNKAYISDDPYELKTRFNIEKYNEVSKKELLLLRYVTGEDTLYEEIKQIEASQIVSFRRGEKSTYRYYRFLGKHDLQLSKKELLIKHEEVLCNVFNRLIQYVNGRTIVIPLSGGYDSRLVACILKKMKYENIITYTFGKEGHPEQLISKMVAENLGYKWFFIPYTNDKSHNWYTSDEFKAFEQYADNLSSIVLDRDWPAVFELKKKGIIPENAVFVPGHSGDFLSGRFLPYDLRKKKAGVDRLIDFVLDTQYTQWDWSGKKSEYRGVFKEKIISSSELNNKSLAGDKLDFYDKWEWQERHGKYIVNSVRIYEYFGFDWWLPLWDKEIIDFWTAITNKRRRYRSFYSYHVAALYSELGNVPFRKAFVREETLNDTNITRFVKKLKAVIRNSPLGEIAMKLYSIPKNIYKLIKPRNNFIQENMENDWEVSLGRLNVNVYNSLAPYLVTRDSSKTLKKLGYIKTEDNSVNDDVIYMLKEMKYGSKDTIL